MARLSQAVSSALGYWWNLIIDAVRLGNTVTDTVSAATDIARQSDQTLNPEDNRAIATLYGYASRMDHAAVAFQAGDISQAIDSGMIGTPPWARDIQEQQTYPLYHVTFTYTYLDQAGNQQSGFRTWVKQFQLPGTIGELNDQIQAAAEAMAQDYGHQLISADPFQVLAV